MRRAVFASTLLLLGCYEEVVVRPPQRVYVQTTQPYRPPAPTYVPPPQPVYPPPPQPVYPPPPQPVYTPPPQPVYPPPPEPVYPPPPEPVYTPPPEPVYSSSDYAAEPQPEVIGVEVEPPIQEPPPVAVEYAPPPLLFESPPPPPFVEAVWVGGYWHWDSGWVWARGRYAAPPRPGYIFSAPYYEHRNGVVIFVGGHWRPPGSVFVPPPTGIRLSISIGRPRPGVFIGARPVGGFGVFVPPPPGSRPGIIVPAPLGTHPAVVMATPPVIRPGLVIQHNNNFRTSSFTNVTVVAPPGVTASGQAVHAVVPARAVPVAPAFGRPLPPPRTGPGFGQPPPGGGFGQPRQPPPGGGFGQPPQPPPAGGIGPPPPGGGFGQPRNVAILW